jgi:bifunctional UDP-N-acetylglucosamine pyrophosphorylase/glucosamine-1-phosphate N-acetyltransferase
LFSGLKKISPANAQGEYYLTDVLAILKSEGQKIGAVVVADPLETMGINNRVQLAEAETIMRLRILNRLMMDGVTIVDPANTYIDQDVTIGADSVVYPGTIIEGKCTIGSECEIGPYSRLRDVDVGQRVTIQNSIILESLIGDEVNIGPFAYIRPGTVLKDSVKVGDFVEIKKSVVGKGSKVPHLSYVGDAEIGEKVNIGAGTITCNYDGSQKWKTTIGNNSFVGSNTNFVAPVEVGENAIIGAGSTVTKSVPDGALCVERGKQIIYPEWVARKNKKK